MSITAAQIKELHKRISGLATRDETVRRHFSTDASIFQIMPEAVVYPRNVSDVQATVAYLAEQAAKDKPVSLVVRGKGSDQSGGALGDGAVLVLPAHLNNLVKLGKNTVTVQAGIGYGTVQQILRTHGRQLAIEPASAAYSTIGGALANDAGGARSLKYGTMRASVESLRVVLADGSLIETRKLSPRELNRKKGIMTLEGEIYRKIDSLIADHSALIRQSQPAVSRNAAGYALGRVKDKFGNFDLSQLFIGAQGTLGIIVEATLRTVEPSRQATLLVAQFADAAKLGEGVLLLQRLNPSALELIDRAGLEAVQRQQPDLLNSIDDLPAYLLIIEFDNQSKFRQNVQSRRAQRLLGKFATSCRRVNGRVDQARTWQLVQAVAASVWMNAGKHQPLPIINDACVPTDKLPEFLDDTAKLLGKHKLSATIWGHAGDGHLQVLPVLDLSKAKDRTKALKLMDDFYAMVTKLGGTPTGQLGDGLLRASYMQKLYGSEMSDVLATVKLTCDPQALLNPRIKLGATKADLEAAMRHEYSAGQAYEHGPAD